MEINVWGQVGIKPGILYTRVKDLNQFATLCQVVLEWQIGALQQRCNEL